MSLIVMLEEAIRIEESVSRCYKIMSMIVPDDNLSRELNRLSLDEKDHANAIKTGKNYVFKNPDLFGKETISDDEIRMGIRLVENLIDDLEQKRADLLGGLKRILDLEKKFEIVHMTTAVEIKEPFLKRLFETLSKDDSDHRRRLEDIVLRYGTD
jgi:rubrerythrin